MNQPSTGATSKSSIEVEIQLKSILNLYTVVKYPDAKEISWDIVGHKHSQFVCVFPFFTKTSTTQILQEYAQGTNQLSYTLPCGGYEPEKHDNILQCAKSELNEEARLTGGQWIRLTEGEGIAEVKWCKNRFIPFLVIDPEEIGGDVAMQRDEEEYINIIKNLSMEEVDEKILNGEFMLPSVQTCIMAKDRLRKLGLL